MCSEHFHVCKVCDRAYPCEEPNWVCPTLNFDENAQMCDTCEHAYYLEMIDLMNQEEEERDRIKRLRSE
jgi:hypothetical protein